MDKQQKQIEEMAKRECGCYIVAQDMCILDRKICNCDCTDYRKAKRFYDYFISIGYQKLSEDSVVLSKEELSKKYVSRDTYDAEIEYRKMLEKRASKETAEKFVNETTKRKQTLMNPYTDDESECVSIYWIYKLAKQLGVEIKEA